MISFSCNSCGKTFSVADELAGRKGKCKSCGAAIVVPQPQSALSDDDIADWLVDGGVGDAGAGDASVGDQGWEKLAKPPAAVNRDMFPPGMGTPAIEATGSGIPVKPVKAKLPVRVRRLKADAELMARAFQKFPLIRVHSAVGSPPDVYQIVYNVRGLARGPNGQPVLRDGHVAEIQLTREYPRQSPKCRMLTPIFHPNIEPATICVGDHWTASERLVDLVIRIGELITYQAYNIQSPLDGEAAMWADNNGGQLPVDRRDLHPPDLD